MTFITMDLTIQLLDNTIVKLLFQLYYYVVHIDTDQLIFNGTN
jgi:hypothetical protein